MNNDKQTQTPQINDRINRLLDEITSDLYERRELVALCLLGIISEQNIFLLGPPGTSKSLISRRLSKVFKDSEFFEALMSRFTTPEDVFGPISIQELKNDKYTRKTQGYLPTADFAFLDEIWKSGPAILNGLLTIINEKTFKNGVNVDKAHLKSLISASNEIPQENQGLEALYDRFSLRLFVTPIKEVENFEKLINSKRSPDFNNIDDNLTITFEELKKWQSEYHNVTLSKNTLFIIKSIRIALADDKENNIYISDRRWQRIAQVLKASAYCNGRKETNFSDDLLLQHCLWENSSHMEVISKIVMSNIKLNGFKADSNMKTINKNKEDLEKEIRQELFCTDDVHSTVLIGGRKCFEVNLEQDLVVYILFDNFKLDENFGCLDKHGNELEKYKYSYNFNGQGSCNIIYEYKQPNGYRSERKNKTFTPQIACYKGDKNKDVNGRLRSVLLNAVKDQRDKSNIELLSIQEQITKYKQELSTPFVSDNEVNEVLEHISKLENEANLCLEDCDRLEKLCEE